MKIYLYGGGGHAKVIIDILQKQNRTVSGIIDDGIVPENPELYGIPIYPNDAVVRQHNPDEVYWIVSIGNNKVRQFVAHKLTNQGYQFTTAIHPSAQISLGAAISPGTVIMANAVINSDVQLGEHVIINTGATVDHDCQIGDYVHIAPGTALCGNVHISEGALLGVGTKIKPAIVVGAWTTCGAGSVVVKSLPSYSVAYGCPAQVTAQLEKDTVTAP